MSFLQKYTNLIPEVVLRSLTPEGPKVNLLDTTEGIKLFIFVLKLMLLGLL